MTQLFVTLYLMYMTVVPIQSAYLTVSEHTYAPGGSSPGIIIQTPEPAPSPAPSPEPKDENVPVDYVKELRTLGFIKDEYEDPDLNIRNGVVRFQAAHNLVADGDFGPKSMAALKKRMSDPEFKYGDTVKNPPSQGKWMMINKSRRNLTLYEGGGVLKKYPIAIGNPPSLTPDGKYKLANMIVNPYWGGAGHAKPVEGGSPYNPLGYRWMGLNIGDGGSYGIHGNNSPYSIGTDASLGCIRMINADVEELFEILSVGTPVWITQDEGLSSMEVEQPEYGQEQP